MANDEAADGEDWEESMRRLVTALRSARLNLGPTRDPTVLEDLSDELIYREGWLTGSAEDLDTPDWQRTVALVARVGAEAIEILDARILDLLVPGPSPLKVVDDF